MKEKGNNMSGGFEGILKGFTDFIEKLGELAEKGEKLSKSGVIHGKKGGQSLTID